LATEREIKRAQVTLLVRIKNKLTPEQQAKLVEIRSKSGNK
jgi:Spy/CpxP family protein refolding chaperone